MVNDDKAEAIRDAAAFKEKLEPALRALADVAMSDKAHFVLLMLRKTKTGLDSIQVGSVPPDDFGSFVELVLEAGKAASEGHPGAERILTDEMLYGGDRE